jgi:hypothetical protein
MNPMPNHPQTCPCRPCRIRRQIVALEDSCLPEPNDIDRLPDDLGGIEELEDYEASR